MATFSVTVSIPDNNLTVALNALKRVQAAESGEGNLAYIKRIIREELAARIVEGQNLLNRDGLPRQIGDQGVGTS